MRWWISSIIAFLCYYSWPMCAGAISRSQKCLGRSSQSGAKPTNLTICTHRKECRVCMRTSEQLEDSQKAVVTQSAVSVHCLPFWAHIHDMIRDTCGNFYLLLVWPQCLRSALFLSVYGKGKDILPRSLPSKILQDSEITFVHVKPSCPVE